MSEGRPGLWRQPDFTRLFAASTVSNFGTMMSAMAVPWLAIEVLEASDTAVAGLATLRMLPGWLLSFAVGAWVDRVARKPLLIGADLARAGLYLLLPALYLWDLLTIEILCAIVVCVAALTVVFSVAVDSFLPLLVARDDLVDANSRLTAGEATAESAGFFSSGWVASWIGTPFVLAVDAATFVASALFLVGVRVDERPSEAPQGRLDVRADLRAGLAELRRVPELRAIALAETLRGAAFGIFMTAYMLWLMRDLGFGKAAIGTIAFTGSLGSIAGAWLVLRMQRALGNPRTLVASLLLAASSYLLIPLAPDTAWLGWACLVGHQVLGDTFDTTWNISSLSTRQRLSDPALLGRVNGFVSNVFSLAMFTSATTCTLLVGWTGTRPLLFVSAALPALAALSVRRALRPF